MSLYSDLSLLDAAARVGTEWFTEHLVVDGTREGADR
jgi:hypothetical protein